MKIEQSTTKKTLLKTDTGNPLIISGPCSAETEEQVLQTALRIKAQGKVDIFRAGIWKPRTRPNSFEGVGREGLGWLQKVKELTGMPVATEVANVRHVAEALDFGVDVLWIGARTSVNPFSVQEIADSLAGTDVTVMVKNPINPDLALWIGAIERLAKAGIKDIGAIHRGFSTDATIAYRNAPKWKIAMAFRKEMPGIPMVSDPSHIGGKREVLSQLSQKALDLGMDGLMIESHITPDAAWSDAKQQITPEVLGDMLRALHLRKSAAHDVTEEELLLDLRHEMNSLDHELLDLLTHRAKVSGKIGSFSQNIPLQNGQMGAGKALIDQLVRKAQAEGLEESFIQSIFALVHEYSEKVQEAQTAFKN